MAPRDCFRVGMILFLFLWLCSAQRLLLTPRENSLAPSLAPAPFPERHIHEHSLAPSPAPATSPRKHIHEQSLAPSLAPAAPANKHNGQHSLTPSLAPGPSANKHLHEHSLAPSLATAPAPAPAPPLDEQLQEHSLSPSLSPSPAPSPNKGRHEPSSSPSLAPSQFLNNHIQAIHHEWRYKAAKEATGSIPKLQKPVSESVQSVNDPINESWFFDSHKENPVSKPWVVLPSDPDYPATDHQHEYAPRRPISIRPDLREDSQDDFIVGGTSSNFPYATVHGVPEDGTFSSQLPSVYENSPPGIIDNVEDNEGPPSTPSVISNTPPSPPQSPSIINNTPPSPSIISNTPPSPPPSPSIVNNAS